MSVSRVRWRRRHLRSRLCATPEKKAIPCARRLCNPIIVTKTGAAVELASTVSAKQAEEVSDKENQQYCSKPNSCAAAITPTAVPVITAATAQHQKQNDQKYQHVSCPLLWATIARPQYHDGAPWRPLIENGNPRPETVDQMRLFAVNQASP